MNVIIIGGYGFLGQNLAKFLVSKGFDVVLTSRSHKPEGSDGMKNIRWSLGYDNELQLATIDTQFVLINLAGEDIAASRWTENRKKKIEQSRIETTKALVNAVKDNPPLVFLQGSAIGIYGNNDDNSVDENSPAGTGFLAQLTHQWESVFLEANLPGTRKLLLRTGVVLGTDGGMLKRLLPLFRLGLGGKLGSGKQVMSWIHLNDWVAAVHFLIENKVSEGAYNLTSPNPVTNAEFTATLAKRLKRPAIMTVPSVVLKIAFGQMAEEMLLKGQRVIPTRLINDGFSFRCKTISEALHQI
jgi:uncharacterized protein (TIGR01777 family)